MVNEGDDKYEGAEESEYHFSDDEVSYEADPDVSKPTPAAPAQGSGLAALASSRRMLISLGVFLSLVFVVYKMVAPSNTPPPTEIAPAKVTAPAAMTAAAPVAAAPATAAPAPVAPAVAAAPAPAPAAAPEVMSPPPVMAVPAPTPTTMPATATPDMNNPMPAANNDAGVQQASMTAPPTSGTEDVSMPMNPAVSSATAGVSAESDRLAAQMQADYEQRLANYQAENKALQDQVQTLNARVASMETEMSQLIQTLTKQFQNTGSADGSDAATAGTDPSAPAVATPDIKLPYTVQAIIPGRAWLRADNGDTLTVAEGDTIKDVGQVTKIDPYDGIVEIKVGNKTVSLSYGGSGG